jgi:2-(1,2-epoxy-1,2-dihydrophenyl)acetyl-CoA isomerase
MDLSMTASETLLVERDGAVATLTLNRPDALNAFSRELRVTFRDAVNEVARDDSVRAVVITGAGRGFSAGQDVRELSAPTEADPIHAIVTDLNQIMLTLVGMPKPVIAAVNGVAAGAGAGLAFAADFRFASRTASFLLAFANVGLTLDSGTSWTLPRLIGSARAAALALLAEPVTAPDALAMGMVNAVVEPEHVLPGAHELALRLAAGPTAAYAAIKQSLNFAATSTFADALAKEEELQHRVAASADHKIAVTAFLAKQKPEFTGR